MVQSGTCSVPWEGTVNGRSCVSWAEAEDQSGPGMSCWACQCPRKQGWHRQEELCLSVQTEESEMGSDTRHWISHCQKRQGQTQVRGIGSRSSGHSRVGLALLRAACAQVEGAGSASVHRGWTQV